LLAEDEVMAAWALIDMVKELGHQICVTVATEHEAIEAVLQLKPEVVVLDYRLAHGGNGFNVASRIREAGDIPIIFCTAYGESLRPALEALSRVHLIAKPVSLDSLRRALAWAADALAPRSPHPPPRSPASL